jgi:hypothetical protein
MHYGGLVLPYQIAGFYSNYVSRWWETHIQQNQVFDEGFTFCFPLHFKALPFVGYAQYEFIFMPQSRHIDYGCFLYIF